MQKRVAIVQSCYIPWKGYFDLINRVDEFILLDDVQYSRASWRNRNRIKTPQGAAWLTIPVKGKGRYHQKARDVEVSDRTWPDRHWKAICRNYAKARCFESMHDVLRDLYAQCRDETLLSRINDRFLRCIAELLGIRTRITRSMDYDVVEGKTERLVHLCRQAGASEYLSGPSARAYLEEDRFRDHGIRVSWMDYAGYPQYAQRYCPPFLHEVSVLDLILNEGCEGARACMLTFGTAPKARKEGSSE